MKTREEIIAAYPIDDPKDVSGDWRTSHDILMASLLREMICQLATIASNLEEIANRIYL